MQGRNRRRRERERELREGGVGEEERYFSWVNAGKQRLGQSW